MRTEQWTVVCLGVLLAAGTAAGEDKTGRIQGVVRFTGDVPPARQLPTGDGATVEHYDLVVDAKSKGLRWVIASLEDAPSQPKFDGDDPAVIDQKDMLFVPRVVTVQHGRPVRFENSDGCNHSAITAARLPANEMNVFVTARDPVTKAFAGEKAPIRIGCALHGSMTAWLYVAPHPWVAVTDEKGAFTLNDVPPGKYTLLLKHPDTGLQSGGRSKCESAGRWRSSLSGRSPIRSANRSSRGR